MDGHESEKITPLEMKTMYGIVYEATKKDYETYALELKLQKTERKRFNRLDVHKNASNALEAVDSIAKLDDQDPSFDNKGEYYFIKTMNLVEETSFFDSLARYLNSIDDVRHRGVENKKDGNGNGNGNGNGTGNEAMRAAFTVAEYASFVCFGCGLVDLKRCRSHTNEKAFVFLMQHLIDPETLHERTKKENSVIYVSKLTFFFRFFDTDHRGDLESPSDARNVKVAHAVRLQDFLLDAYDFFVLRKGSATTTESSWGDQRRIAYVMEPLICCAFRTGIVVYDYDESSQSIVSVRKTVNPIISEDVNKFAYFLYSDGTFDDLTTCHRYSDRTQIEFRVCEIEKKEKKTTKGEEEEEEEEKRPNSKVVRSVALTKNPMVPVSKRICFRLSESKTGEGCYFELFRQPEKGSYFSNSKARRFAKMVKSMGGIMFTLHTSDYDFSGLKSMGKNAFFFITVDHREESISGNVVFMCFSIPDQADADLTCLCYKNDASLGYEDSFSSRRCVFPVPSNWNSKTDDVAFVWMKWKNDERFGRDLRVLEDLLFDKLVKTIFYSNK